MKKLVFIDYDWEQDSKDELHYLKRKLYHFADVEDSRLKNIECHFRIGDKSNEELAQLLFDDNSVILTYSMFTPTHYGSLYSLLYFLEIAGKQQIKNKVYIDCACYLLDTLNRNVSLDDKESKDIIKCIKNNYIIGYNDSTTSFRRIVLSGEKYDIFKDEEISVNNLL